MNVSSFFVHSSYRCLSFSVISLFLFVSSFLATSCATAPSSVDISKDSALKERARDNNLTYSDFETEKVDINADGLPDQVSFFREGKLVRIERDLNFDGRVNLWLHYAKDGSSLVEEEADLDSDGKVDVVNQYANGRTERRLISTGFSNLFQIVKIYADNGELLRIERDTNDDGKVDLIDYYEEGRRVRTGIDLNGDGVPDTFDEIGE